MTAQTDTTRRAFLKAGALAAVPAAGLGLPAAALASDDSKAALARMADERALEGLARDFVRAFNRGGAGAAAPLFADGRAPMLPVAKLALADEEPQLAISGDGDAATASLACTVEEALALEGEETLVRMARLQGNAAGVQATPKTLRASFVRHADGWRIASVDLA